MRNPEPLPVSIPKPLQNIIARALAKDINVRYKSAAEMRSALRNPHETDPNFQPDKSVYTVQSPINTMPPQPVHLKSEKKSNAPHFIYAIAGLLAVVIIIGGLVWLNSGAKEVSTTNSSTPAMFSVTPTPINKSNANSASSVKSDDTPKVSSFPFTVKKTQEHYESGLESLGSYEIAIPADNQWHDTNITLYPNNQMQIGFMKGTEGNVEIRAGNVSGSFSESQPDNIWYEFDLVNRQPRSRFDHVFKNPSTLKVRSNQNNVVIKVDVRQL